MRREVTMVLTPVIGVLLAVGGCGQVPAPQHIAVCGSSEVRVIGAGDHVSCVPVPKFTVVSTTTYPHQVVYGVLVRPLTSPQSLRALAVKLTQMAQQVVSNRQGKLLVNAFFSDLPGEVQQLDGKVPLADLGWMSWQHGKFFWEMNPHLSNPSRWPRPSNAAIRDYDQTLLYEQAHPQASNAQAAAVLAPQMGQTQAAFESQVNQASFWETGPN